MPGAKHAEMNSENNGQHPASTSKIPYDPELLNKYRPKEAKIAGQQSKLEEERNKIYTKYKLAGKDSDYEHKLAKLDKKRDKLVERESKLAKSYQLEAERKTPKPCKGNNCPAPCGPGTTFTRKGCVPTPPVAQYPQCGRGYYLDGIRCVQYARECPGGYRWNGSQCIDQTYISSVQPRDPNCTQSYLQLMQQKKNIENLKQLQASACAANSKGSECNDYTQQLSIAESAYRQLQEQYRSMCALRP
ncbi:MAG TPA: hypothetical protein VLK33_01300 [Terriglobales bacterium]|nr:hypothetical protein [Terriglobales bacterium]